MGIINCTPNSFYANSRHIVKKDIVNTAIAMVDDGADILDLGGESTRPGSSAVDAEEQIRRVVPAIKAIRAEIQTPLSIDTQLAAVAEAALDAGADIINDISALRTDPAMGKLVAERNVRVVLMHMQGQPETMQDKPCYQNVVAEVREFLVRSVNTAVRTGIEWGKIILDPGIGFGKRVGDNLKLLQNIEKIRIDGLPILVGLSRKSFIGHILGQDLPEDRLNGTLAAQAWCLSQGVDILRVHDVKETWDLIKIWNAINLNLDWT